MAVNILKDLKKIPSILFKKSKKRASKREYVRDTEGKFARRSGHNNATHHIIEVFDPVKGYSAFEAKNI